MTAHKFEIVPRGSLFVKMILICLHTLALTFNISFLWMGDALAARFVRGITWLGLPQKFSKTNEVPRLGIHNQEISDRD